jgi:tRNA modification GTPase
MNALLGYQRVIVHPMPGTTRDVVTAATAIDGWPVELTDTAGLHKSPEPVESAGIELARRRVAQADLVVLVFDASEDWSDEDAALRAEWPKALCVHNKCDLVGAEHRANAPLPGLHASALCGQGLNELQREIGSRLVNVPPPAGQAVPFLAQQVAGLETIRDALVAGRVNAAKRTLARPETWGGSCC